MIPLLALLLAQPLAPQTVSPVGTPARNAVTVQGSASSTPMIVTGTVATTGTFWPNAATSTPTTYAMAGAVVAQRPTTTSFVPSAGTLTAATATQVFAATAGVCQVAVQNRDAAIHMFCGQTNAVSVTIGLDLSPGGVYTTTPGYGGSLYCYPASGTPAYATQATSCP